MGTMSSIVAMVAVVLGALVAGGSCSPPKVPPGPNITTNYDGKWLAARSTWYGQPIGPGPDDNGGACGIKDVNLPPYSGMTSCDNDPIFKDGKGCGLLLRDQMESENYKGTFLGRYLWSRLFCFKICANIGRAPKECADKPVMVFITDMNYEPIASYHFDLSGKAFGAMAKPGLEDKLRHRGIIDMEFRRVRCKYPPGQKIVFHVEKFSNPNYLAVLVKFVVNDGDIVQMDLKEAASLEWRLMKLSWGAIWRMDTAKPLNGPFSVRITSESGKKLVATDVIPEKWKADTFYKSNIQI